MVVNLTVMLVLVTMFISVSEGLPKTSYIKMIDVGLVFVLLIPFFEVSSLSMPLFLSLSSSLSLSFCFYQCSPPPGASSHNNRYDAP